MGALSTSDGSPTGGIYGFAAISMEIVRNLNPTKVVVAWDSKTSTSKRKTVYADYKAGRVKPGEDFYAQIPMLKELVEALGWSFVECDDYEADDIIGTLVLQADSELDDEGKCEWETFIVSSDLDMLQIVDENTRMFRVLKGFSKLEELDVAGVEKKYGIKKAQFLDLKALKGDASDNIPGVPGVGEKTAVKLLNEYGSLDGVYEALDTDKISGKVAEKLRAGRKSAEMSYYLAKIMTDAPVDLDELPDLMIDEKRILAALNKLEFRSLVRKFGKALRQGGEEEKAPPSLGLNVSEKADGRELGKAQVVGKTQVVEKAGGRESGKVRTVARKTSTTTDQPTLEVPIYTENGILLSWNVKDLMHKNPKIAEKIIKDLTSYEYCDKIERYGDEKALSPSLLVERLGYYDLNQGAFLLNPLARGIERIDEKAEFARQMAEFAEKPELFAVLMKLDLPLIPVLYEMEKEGMLVDRKYFDALKQEFQAEVERLEEEVWQIAGKEFNLNSPVQLSQVLFVDLGLPTKGIKKTARGYSTGVKELDKLEGQSPIIEKLKEYREAAKLLSTYIEPLPEMADKNGRVHTTFNQDVTATGRLSSVNPNLQNIPVRTEEGRRIRTGFVAPEGRALVSADYSQFELRLAAVMGNDEALINDFNQDVDIHTKTAAEAFGVPAEEVTKAQRRAAKVINFGVLYGMSVRGLSQAAAMSYGEAKQFIENYFELRKPIKDYLDKVLQQARELGYVQTYFGRRRPTPDVLSTNFIVRTAAERAAQNMPIQGTEADLMKRAMLRVNRVLPDGAKMIMQVHDSLIIECDKGQVEEVSELLQREMMGVAPELPIKLAVEVTVGQNWGEL